MSAKSARADAEALVAAMGDPPAEPIDLEAVQMPNEWSPNYRRMVIHALKRVLSRRGWRWKRD